VTGCAVTCAAAGVLAQICYPLLDGRPLAVATAVSVVSLAAAALLHAAATYGPAGGATVLVGAGGIGLLAEAVGTRTGVPFGAYRYGDSLGPSLLGVPLLVPLAWIMLAYPCLLLARSLASSPSSLSSSPGSAVRRALLGAVALTGWDLFLDPQMVAAGHWTWRHPEPALPGVPGVPLTNYAGWLLVAAVLIAVLDLCLPDRRLTPGQQAVPAAVLAWTWLGSALGNLAFFHRPWVAAYGFLVMGCVAAPYLWRQLTAPAGSTRPASSARLEPAR
jgi:putative membrane protein